MTNSEQNQEIQETVGKERNRLLNFIRRRVRQCHFRTRQKNGQNEYARQNDDG